LVDKFSPKPFSESLSLIPLSNTHLITVERVDKVPEDETIPTKSGGTHRYLIRWKERTSTVDSQLDRCDLNQIDQVQQGSTISLDSMGLVFSHPERMMRTSGAEGKNTPIYS